MDCGSGFKKSETEEGEFSEKDPSCRYGRVRVISNNLLLFFKKNIISSEF